MNKRGATQKTLLFIFYILLAVIILSSLTIYLKDYFNQSRFNKEFLVKDLGLTMDVFSFSPNKIEGEYNLTSEFIIEIRNSILYIKLKDMEVPRKYELISKRGDMSKKADKIEIKK